MILRPCLVAALLAVAATAHARASTALVGVATCREPAMPRHLERVRAALSSRLGADLMTSADVEAAVGRPARSTLDDLKRALEAGKAGWYTTRYDTARPLLQKVMDEAPALEPSAERDDVYEQAVAHAALIAANSNHKPLASDLARRLLRPDTAGWRPTLKLYPPSFIAFVSTAAEAVRAEASATLVVKAPGASNVWVDTRRFPAPPMGLKLTVPPGTYAVQAVWEGSGGGDKAGGVPERRVSIVRTTTVATTAVVELDRDLDGGIGFVGPSICLDIHPREPPETRVARLGRLMALLDARTLVAIREERQGPDVFLTATTLEGPTETREARVKLDARGEASDAAMARLAAFQLEGGEVEPPVQAIKGRGTTLRDQRKPEVRAAPAEAVSAREAPPTPPMKIAGWISFGAGAVAAAVAGYFAVAAGQSDAQLAKMQVAPGLAPDREAAQVRALQGSAATQASLAVALGLAGGAVALGGVAMLMFAPAPPGGGDGFVAGATLRGRF